MSNHQAIVCGASKGIGLAVVKRLLEHGDYSRVCAVSRSATSSEDLTQLRTKYPQLSVLQADITMENEIEALVPQLGTETLSLLLNCVGALHNDFLSPEKSLRDISMEQMLESFKINTVPSLLLAKHLLPLFRGAPKESVFAVLSARVGSIEDNRSGGWYGYRASKAALHMCIKNISIEYGRKCPYTSVVALHPGTVDTQLSKPFQRNVPEEKLFSPERAALQLLEVVNGPATQSSGLCFAWDGTVIPW